MEKLIKPLIEKGYAAAVKKSVVFFHNARKLAYSCRMINIYFGKSKSRVPENSIIFFPYTENRLNCGLAGIISFKGEEKPDCPSIRYLGCISLRDQECPVSVRRSPNFRQSTAGIRRL